jgi:hypothetical protein
MIGIRQPQMTQWPSIDDAKPSEQGGPVARGGFNYQDEVAVSFLIDMLADPTILKIHLETHDDIVVVRAADPLAIAEYVQVKSAQLDKLWSVADLCRGEEREGTSIFELSLGRDKYLEASRFRLVTLRPVVDELKVLTLEPGATGREPCGTRFLALHGELWDRFPGIRSPKNNGAAYWLKHCHWDIRHSELALESSNFVRLLRIATSEGKYLLVDQIDLLLEELRFWAKHAGDALWEPDRSVKILSRMRLRAWWEKRTVEILDGASSVSGDKLARKMRAAFLAEDQVRMAIELRRDYARIVRTSRYMENDLALRLQSQVKSELTALRARFVAGQIPFDPPGFHSLCVERMKVINSGGSDDNVAFLIGCMYDITDRCLHQFERPSP